MFILSMVTAALCIVLLNDALYHFICSCVTQFSSEEMRGKMPKLKRIFGAYAVVCSVVLVMEIMICFNFATLPERGIGLIVIIFGLSLTSISGLSTKGAPFKSEMREKKFDKFIKTKAALVSVCPVLLVVNIVLLHTL